MIMGVGGMVHLTCGRCGCDTYENVGVYVSDANERGEVDSVTIAACKNCGERRGVYVFFCPEGHLHIGNIEGELLDHVTGMVTRGEGVETLTEDPAPSAADLHPDWVAASGLDG